MSHIVSQTQEQCFEALFLGSCESLFLDEQHEELTDHNKSVLVRQHTRKKPKTKKVSTGKKTKPKFDKNRKVTPSIDPASFSTIMKIQSQQMAEYKEKRVICQEHLETTAQWSTFWCAAAKQRKRKRPNFVWKTKQNKTLQANNNYLRAINDLTKPMFKR